MTHTTLLHDPKDFDFNNETDYGGFWSNDKDVERRPDSEPSRELKRQNDIPEFSQDPKSLKLQKISSQVQQW